MFSLLLTQQQKLAELVLGPVTFNCVPLLSSGYFGDALWSTLHSLAIPEVIGSKDDLHAYWYMLQRCSELE